MPTIITSGHLHVTPLTMQFGGGISQLREQLALARYEGDINRPGWGSWDDDLSRLGKRWLDRPAGGMPGAVAPAEASYPARLDARLYFDRYDTRLARETDDHVDARYLHRLDAVDVLFAEIDGGQYQVLASTYSQADINRYVMPSLRAIASGDRDSVGLGRSAGAIPDDLFLWLLYRYNHTPALSGDLRIEVIRTVLARDRSYRRTNIMEEALLERRAVLAAIAEPKCVFGPLKMSIGCKSLRLHADFELRPDGGFAIHLERSDYEDQQPARAILGRRLVTDTAFVIIPGLERAYARDRAWQHTHRDEFIDAAVAQLRAM